jgi:hypothetical protein
MQILLYFKTKMEFEDYYLDYNSHF